MYDFRALVFKAVFLENAKMLTSIGLFCAVSYSQCSCEKHFSLSKSAFLVKCAAQFATAIGKAVNRCAFCEVTDDFS
jgi:hypothetical protein